MDADRVLHHLLRELDKIAVEQQSFLGSGSAKDFAEYRYVCGTIRGSSPCRNSCQRPRAKTGDRR